jgi:hypothetical protein
MELSEGQDAGVLQILSTVLILEKELILQSVSRRIVAAISTTFCDQVWHVFKGLVMLIREYLMVV